jgi:hypothetical protein
MRLEGKRDRKAEPSDETEAQAAHTVVLRRHHNDDLCSPPTKTKISEGRSPVFWGASFPQKKSSFGERKMEWKKTKKKPPGAYTSVLFSTGYNLRTAPILRSEGTPDPSRSHRRKARSR